MNKQIDSFSENLAEYEMEAFIIKFITIAECLSPLWQVLTDSPDSRNAHAYTIVLLDGYRFRKEDTKSTMTPQIISIKLKCAIKSRFSSVLPFLFSLNKSRDGWPYKEHAMN